MSMRQASSSKRSRSKGGNRGGGGRNPLNRSYESNGPGGKIRGNPHQLYEKYLSMARDALSADDRVLSENLTQHADHYFRVILEAGNGKGQQDDANRQDAQKLDGQDTKGGQKDGGDSQRSRGNGADMTAEAEGQAQGNGADKSDSGDKPSAKTTAAKRRGRPRKSSESASEASGEEDTADRSDAA